ncbi:MAG TPA: translocation/assembly module TamB domain-containing protein [Limnobacter sp.]|nr:translocation/assembly module TamB domain-containing protein [Limnobacter sp.]
MKQSRLLIFSPFLFLLVCMIAGAGWLLGTQAGLQFAVHHGQSWLTSGGERSLRLEVQSGSLWHGFVAKFLHYQDGDLVVEIDRLQFKADWPALLEGHARIQTLSASAVSIKSPPTKEDDPPLVLPERVNLPLDVTLEELSVGRVQVDGFVLHNVTAKAYARGEVFELERLRLDVEGASVQSNATVKLMLPYEVGGHLGVQRDYESLKLTGDLALTGSLQRMDLALTANGQDFKKPQRNQSLEVHAIVRPLELALLEKVRANAQRFNPQQWFNAAPSALLDLDIHLEPNADLSASKGQLHLVNNAPQAWQRGGVPVQLLRAEFNVGMAEQRPQTLRVQVHELQLADGRRMAGQLAGVAVWQAPPSLGKTDRQPDMIDGPLALDLTLRGVDASVFADLPKRTALHGRVQVDKRGQTVALKKLDLKNGETAVQAQGNVLLAAPMHSDLSLTFSQFNPAAYMVGSNPLLEGRLNGQLEFAGMLMPPGEHGKASVFPQGRLRVAVDNSRLANAPLRLQVDALGSQQRVENLDLDLDVMGNTLRAQGSYGALSDTLDVQANLAKLKPLGKAIGMTLDGNALVTGSLRGQGAAVSGQVRLEASQLRVADALQLSQARGQFELGAQPESPWQGQLQIDRLGQPGATVPWLQTLVLNLEGTRTRHRLLARFDSGQNRFSDARPFKGELGVQGGLKPKGKQQATLAWQGALDVLKVEGLWWPTRSVALAAPAPVLLAPGLFQMQDLVLNTEDGSVFRNTLLKVSHQDIRVEGNAPRFLIPRLSPILGQQMPVEPNNLYTRIQWRYVATPSHVDGRVDVSHVSGGLQVLEDSQIDVSIQTFKANLNFNRDSASLSVDVHADEFGLVTASLSLPVEQNPVSKSWGVASDKTMQGTVAASFTRLNWLGPMISGGVRTSGNGQVAMAIAGTMDQPDVKGRAFATALNVFQLDQGVRLEDGNVVVDFTTDHAEIETFEFTVYNRQVPRRQIEALGPLIQGAGKITAQGRWNLSGQHGELLLKADRVPLLQRPDRWLMTNASISVKQPLREGEALRIRGEVDALGAYVEMPDTGPETLGDDVFIQGRSETLGSGTPIDFQLQANLGERFYLNAEGLRTRLKGGMRLVMLEGVGGSGVRRSGRRLSATGTIEAVDGTYRAYGQDLTIDRGVVNFQGPLDNPGLNVRAVRKGVAVEAGVEVTGTAQRPKITLISDPAVPDSEKLSWMIIGRGSNSADRDSTLLLTAAAAIFGDSDESTTRKIARSVGIDDFSLSTGSLTAADSRAVGSKVAIAPGADVSANVIGADDPLLSQRIISLGKRFSDRVYLSFDQSVTTAASILKLNYQYSRRLSFIARTGADNAVDVLYQFSFD